MEHYTALKKKGPSLEFYPDGKTKNQKPKTKQKQKQVVASNVCKIHF